MEVFFLYSLAKNATYDLNVDRFKGAVFAFDTPLADVLLWVGGIVLPSRLSEDDQYQGSRNTVLNHPRCVWGVFEMSDDPPADTFWESMWVETM